MAANVSGGKLFWAAGIDNSGLKKDSEQSVNIISEMGNKIERNKVFNSLIQQSKQTVKEIEKDVKELQNAYDKLAGGKAKSAAGGEVGSAKRALTEERAALQGLQAQQIENNKKEVDSQGGIISSLKGWALGLVSIGAAMKIAKSIIASTEESAHKFDVVIAEATAGVGYFFKSIASGDWSNFFSGLRDAIQGAKEFVDGMEVIERRSAEQLVLSAEAQKKIAVLREGTYDKGIENVDKLIAADKEIIEIQKTDYKNQAKIAEDTYNLTLGTAAKANSIEKEKLATLVLEYSKNKDMLDLGVKYNKLKDDLSTIQSLQPNATMIPVLQEEIRLLGQEGVEAGKVAMKFGKVDMPMVKDLAKLKANQVSLEAQAQVGNMRSQREIAMAINKKEAAEKTAADKVIEDAKKRADYLQTVNDQITALKLSGINKEYAELKSKYEADLKEWDKDEKIKVSLKEKYALDRYEIEKKYLEKLKEANKKISEAFDKLDPGKGYSILNRTLINDDKTPATGESVKTMGHVAALKSSAAWSEDMQKKINKETKEGNKDNTDSLKDQAKLREQIVRAVQDLVMQIGQQIGLDESTMNLLGSAVDAFGKLASGDIVGAALGMLGGLISQIPTEAAKFAKQIDDINRLLELQQRLIEKSQRTGGEKEALQGEIDLLKEQLAVTTAAQLSAQKKADTHLDLLGWRHKKAQELANDMVDVQNKVEDAQTAYDDFMAGGTTSNTITDAIAQGFRDGKTAVDDFGSYLNDVLVDAILNIFKAQTLLPLINEKLTPVINAALENGIIDKTEAANIAKIRGDITTEVADKWKQMTENVDLGLTPADTAAAKPTGLAGAISQQLTEITGGILAGTLNGIQISVIEQLSTFRESIVIQKQIALNTLRTADILEGISLKANSSDSLRGAGL